jgi:hypothetical protein
MRKIILMLGTILIATILISGSAVAGWHYSTIYSSYNCTSITNIEGAEDGYHATLGVDGSPVQNPGTLGWVLLDLSSDNAMGPDQDFTVFADSSIEELYDAYVGETPNPYATSWVGQGGDTNDEIFTTPSTPNKAYRYIFIEGTTGSVDLDPHYGPEIDAVGWESP